MKNIIVFLIVFVLFSSVLLFSSPSFAEEEISFKVLVNASSPTVELTKKETSKLFLKKIKRWKENNEAVLPVDQVEDSPVREQFSEEIHGKKVSSIKAYWQKQIFSGRGVPPPEKASDEEVLKYVEKNVGAIGYVSESTEIDTYAIKVVKITE